MNVIVTLAAPPTLGDLERRLAGAGWKPGTPPGLTNLTVQTDLRICKQMKCPGCKRRGLEYRPYHRGQRYRVLAACPHCHAAEEF